MTNTLRRGIFLAKTLISILDSRQQLTAEIKQILFDASIQNRYKSLGQYLQTQKIEYDPRELTSLITLVEKSVYDQINYFAHLMYYIYDLTGDWGGSGEQQVKMTFCRYLLGIPVDKPITSMDAFNFMTQVEENIHEMAIHNLSVESAKSFLKNFAFKCFGREFQKSELERLSKLMQFSGSGLLLYHGLQGAEDTFILGEGRSYRKYGYDIVEIHRELIITPNMVLPMVALMAERTTYLRFQAFQTIFHMKWAHTLTIDPKEKALLKDDINHNVSEGIKRRTLKLFNATDMQSLMAIQDSFIQDMSETILFHELGHGVIKNDVMSLEQVAIAEASELFFQNIASTLLEFLSDFTPRIQDVKGPIQNMIEIAQTDRVRATRMYYMYFSDTWFFDTEDTHMYTYSDLMSLILLKYINDDASIDFERLAQDIVYHPDRTNVANLSMYDRVVDLLAEISQEIRDRFCSATYTVIGQDWDYKTIRTTTIRNFKEAKWIIDDQSYHYQGAYWKCIASYFKRMSNQYDQMIEYLQSEERKTLKKMMVLSAGRAKAEQYRFHHRDYVRDRLRQLGIIAFQSHE